MYSSLQSLRQAFDTFYSDKTLDSTAKLYESIQSTKQACSAWPGVISATDGATCDTGCIGYDNARLEVYSNITLDATTADQLSSWGPEKKAQLKAHLNALEPYVKKRLHNLRTRPADMTTALNYIPPLRPSTCALSSASNTVAKSGRYRVPIDKSTGARSFSRATTSRKRQRPASSSTKRASSSELDSRTGGSDYSSTQRRGTSSRSSGKYATSRSSGSRGKPGRSRTRSHGHSTKTKSYGTCAHPPAPRSSNSCWCLTRNL